MITKKSLKSGSESIKKGCQNSNLSGKLKQGKGNAEITLIILSKITDLPSANHHSGIKINPCFAYKHDTLLNAGSITIDTLKIGVLLQL